MRSRPRTRSARPRLLIACAAGALLIFLAHPTAASLAAGGPLIAAGAALRAWGAGHLVKTEALTTSGPYAHLRHPLYAGTLIVALGFTVASGLEAAVWVLPPFLLVFFLHYFPYKDRIESARLERLYGGTYAAYQAAVPALLAARRPWRPEGQPGFPPRWSARRFRDNNEDGTLLAVGAGLALLALRPQVPI